MSPFDITRMPVLCFFNFFLFIIGDFIRVENGLLDNMSHIQDRVQPIHPALLPFSLLRLKVLTAHFPSLNKPELSNSCCCEQTTKTNRERPTK
jgi:hypothetical protein